ncbi:MAG: SAM-dependent methyltransferase [Paracoccaceae bacterium]|nr:SAM-dependent methyltransferase [Paracoccaceae bacterium]
MANDLFDMNALARIRGRARQSGESALFLHEIAAREALDRLAEIKRTFSAKAIVTAFPDYWKQYFPDADFVSESETLDFQRKDYDLVIHALSMHWANDPVGQMIQCRLALKPDGLFLGVMFGGQTLNELRSALAEAESSLSGGLSPRVAPMAELRDMGSLLMRAGFALPVADNVVLPVTYASLPDLLRDLRLMGETNALRDRPRNFTRRKLFARAAEIYHQHFPADQNRLTATFEMIWLTGWAPDESQPKPLRPGSAQARLADALGTIEFSASDAARLASTEGNDKT